MLSDIEISRKAKLKNIVDVAKQIDINAQELELYGNYKAKINKKIGKQKGKLILVTAMNPTKYGEGKTTVSISLADALNVIKGKTALALREPSLGPVFGIKGGACGGGYSQIVPMEEINLHFTGDFHAITSANNLLSAVIDNHIFQGNKLNIKKVVWQRCLDVNDRALRKIKILSKNKDCERTEEFVITAASEIMAILCLSENLTDLKTRLSNILIGYNAQGKEIFVKDLKVEDSLTALLKEAIKPNLVQTLEGTPAFVHGGPFANIAHGCNSVIATKTALSCSDYVVTEAGFGAELGAEKFFNIKCRKTNLNPHCIVLVVTARSVKYNAGISDEYINQENLTAIQNGFVNVERHVKNLQSFNKQIVVAINKFNFDTKREIDLIKELCNKLNVKAVECEGFEKGSKGAMQLAKQVLNVLETPNQKINYTYELTDNVKTKIEKIAKNLYGASKVTFSKTAQEQIKNIEKNSNYSKYPICIAKTQYSFSSNEKLLGAPENFSFNIQQVNIKSGAQFIVVVCGKTILMPGLNKNPNAEKIKINTKNGNIDNLM